jgi:hypothetical protein
MMSRGFSDYYFKNLPTPIKEYYHFISLLPFPSCNGIAYTQESGALLLFSDFNLKKYFLKQEYFLERNDSAGEKAIRG